MEKLKLIFYFLVFSFISLGQDSPVKEPGLRISDGKTNPFVRLSNLQSEYGKLNDSLAKDLFEYDSILQYCDEVIEISKIFNYSTSILNVEFKFHSKGTKEEKLTQVSSVQLEDSLLLKILSNGVFICFLIKGEIVYIESSCEYDNTYCENGFGIWSSSPKITINEVSILVNNKLLFIREDESISFLNFKKNKLISSYLIEERYPFKSKVLKQFCSINPFNLQEGYCSYSAYSDEFIQTINSQFERIQTYKAALEEIYRRVKGSNLFKKF